MKTDEIGGRGQAPGSAVTPGLRQPSETQSDSARGRLLYGVQAVADYLSLPLAVGKHRIETGIIPTFKMDRAVFSTSRMLDDWLAKCEAKAKPKPEGAAA